MNKFINVFSINNLSASYGKKIVLNSVSFDVYKNEIFLIIGHNGAGKTSLINAILGIIPIKQGEIKFQNESISKLQIFERLNLGMALVPQEKGIFKNLTIVENLAVSYSTILKTKKQKFKNKIDEIFTLFPDLFRYKKEIAGKLSGGQQQMLAISMALIKEPKILFMDEPSLGLSPVLVEKIYDFMISYKNNQELTVILVEQDIWRAAQISDRVAILNSGNLMGIFKSSELNYKLLWEMF
ncbi:MAG: ABC transporter ATP-binding protein [Caldisphaera sp.]|jgi:branched-chain amino acid transport system ATP-binding protein